MDRKKIEALTQAIGSNPDTSIRAARELCAILHDGITSIFREAYRSSRKWQQRAWYVYLSVPYARTSIDALALGVEALNDKSHVVRYRACMLLAYSLSDDVVSHLEKVYTHKDPKTAEDAKAAVDAIMHKNHHYFVDRDHSGKATLSIPELRQ